MAATAYAALVSLMNTIALERTPPPSYPPIPFDGAMINALLETVGFLVEFLEQGWKGAQHLEGPITDLAYAAEDAIESPNADHIRARFPNSCYEWISVPPSQDLKTIIGAMSSIRAEMEKIKKRAAGMKDLHLRSQNGVTSSSNAPRREITEMVGLKDEKIQLMEKLVAQKPSLQVIPIVGAGGIGKTTLARNVYNDKTIVEHFDNVCAWVTISQEYNVENILKVVLYSVNEGKAKEGDKEYIGEEVHKSLFGRKYLIILDDMWDIRVWNEIRRFFPDNQKGSRIMVTTRLLILAKELGTCNLHNMKCLDDESSWALLRKKVFGQESCPIILVEVGKMIAKHCKGLPLAIIVIGGLLTRSTTLGHWKHIADDFSSSIYLNNDEHSLNIVSLSYNNLPVHLKPCFLYLGAFPADYLSRVSQLTKMWVAEGFVKPNGKGETYEEIAEQYLEDLINRNLIMVEHQTKFGRKIKYCAMHDVIRELCLREAQNENFLYIVNAHNLSNLQCMERPRCMGCPSCRKCPRHFVIQLTKVEWKRDCQIIIDSLQLKLCPRSLIINNELANVLKFSIFWKLRVLLVMSRMQTLYCGSDSNWWVGRALPNLVNLRYIDIPWYDHGEEFNGLPFSMGLFRNLQMLVLNSLSIRTPLDIWSLPQLRDIECDGFTLLEPSSSNQQEHDRVILENLQALMTLKNFIFCDEVTKRIPNVKKIRVWYDNEACQRWSHYCAHNLGSLQRLENLRCSFPFSSGETHLLQTLAFPRSIKKLFLQECELHLKEMSVIGSLPNLEVLKLEGINFIGSTWEPIEGEFLGLKVLYMYRCFGLKNWIAGSSHFPRLEQLIFEHMFNLEEIPEDIGNIQTLKLIDMKRCTPSANISAKKIFEAQEEFANDTLVVKIQTTYKSRSLEGIASSNFIVETSFNCYEKHARARARAMVRMRARTWMRTSVRTSAEGDARTWMRTRARTSAEGDGVDEGKGKGKGKD